jgi:hypothetical protein
VAGIDQRMANGFSVPTLLIAVPIAEMSFVDIATLNDGWCLWRLALPRRHTPA